MKKPVLCLILGYQIRVKETLRRPKYLDLPRDFYEIFVRELMAKYAGQMKI